MVNIFVDMHYLSIESLTKSYADKPLFQDISFNINEGDKAALVAFNGSGKSTLLHIITGEEIADEGKVWINKDVQVVMLEQDAAFNIELTIAEIIFQHDHPVMNALRAYELLLEKQDQNEAEMQAAIAKMDEMNAWQFESTVHQILDKLNIKNLQQKVGTLSGGERKRIALAKVLIDLDFEHRHTLLILDEPTNHLDVAMIEWLEHYLTQDRMTLILVTHDRYFLDNVCNRILELSDRQLYQISGKYEDYLEQKAQREEQAQASLEKAKNRYRKELEWMRKQPKARTTKSKARQEAFYDWKEKATKRMEQQQLELDMKMSRLGGKILELKKLYKSYDDKIILKGFDYTFKKGEKVGIVGKNGAGKSTFINIILGKEKEDSGKINVGETVVFGDFSQDGLQIKEDQRVIEYVKSIAEYFPLADGTKLSAAQFLQRFLFTPEKQFTYISKLSGGEQKRLQLLTVLFRNPNFLVLDEPTNDLDLPTLDILEEFLSSFPGCLMIVSHDRYFMDKLVDHLFVFEGEGEIRDFPGNYAQYRFAKKEEEQMMLMEQEKSTPIVTKNDKPLPSVDKKLNYKEKRELEEINNQLPRLEEEKNALTLDMSDPSLPYESIQEKSQKLESILHKIEEMEMRWLELSERDS